MPYSIREGYRDCEGFAVVKDENGDLMGCHTSRAEAQDQIVALNISESKSMSDHEEIQRRGDVAGDTVVYPGRTVKDLNDKGLFGGYLVRFGEDEQPDLEGDFFTKDTNFFLEEQGGDSLVFYGHGWDKEVGVRPVTSQRATLTVKDAGVWMEAQMEARDEYEEMIMELARQGKLGLSSGTASHLVTTEQKGQAQHIKTWPLGVDASFTPQPAEPRTLITPLKQYGKHQHRRLKSIAADLLGIDGDGSTPEPEPDADLIRTIKDIRQRLRSGRGQEAGDAAVIRDITSIRQQLQGHA